MRINFYIGSDQLLIFFGFGSFSQFNKVDNQHNIFYFKHQTMFKNILISSVKASRVLTKSAVRAKSSSTTHHETNFISMTEDLAAAKDEKLKAASHPDVPKIVKKGDKDVEVTSEFVDAMMHDHHYTKREKSDIDHNKPVKDWSGTV